MPDRYLIEITFDREAQRKLKLTDLVIIRKGTVVSWVVNDINNNSRRNYSFNLPNLLNFKIYFTKETPFNKNIFETTIEVPNISEGQGEIGGATAENPGEFKYGITVMDNNSKEIIYDEDPYIIVI